MPWLLERRSRSGGGRKARPRPFHSAGVRLLRRLRPNGSNGAGALREPGRRRNPAARAARHLGDRHGATLRNGIPSLVTLAALGCGLAAIEATRAGSFDLALRLILLAAVADGIDGPLARRLRADGAMGKQLDSLSDIVSFGVAPAFLFSTYYAPAPDAARFGVALGFVAAGAYRLARFNAQPSSRNFSGLPITAAGLMLAITVAGPFTGGVWTAAVVAVALTVLMVGTLPFPTLARWRWTLLPVLVAVMVPIALWPQAETLAILAGVGAMIYLVSGFAGRFPRRVAAVSEEAAPDARPRG